MSNVDINVDRWIDGQMDGQKIGRLYRTLLQAGAIKISRDFMRGIFNNPYAVFLLIFFIKAYIVGTHLNCLGLSRQFI